MRKAPPIVLLALAAAVAAPARADSPAPPTAAPSPGAAPAPSASPAPDPAKTAAHRFTDLVKRGAESCAAGDVDEGLAALHAAWSQRQDAELAVAVATCEIKAQDWPSAAEHLAYALRVKDDPAQRKPLEATFVNVRARVGAVKVTVSIDGADVFVGDRFAGQSPLPGEVYVAPGKGRISAKKTGYGEIEGQVEVKAGATATLTLDLAGEGMVASSRHYTESRSKTPAYVLGGLGAATVATGIALYAAALSKGAAADDILAALRTDYPRQSASPCNPTHAACDTVKSLRSSHDGLANAGTGFLAAGGALVGAAVIYGLWATFSTPAPERPRLGLVPTLAPAVSPSGGGFVLRATF